MSTKTELPEPFHPDLVAARRIPPFSVGPRSLWLFRLAPRGLRSTDDVHIANVPVAGPAGTQTYRVFRPIAARKPRAALLWIHGGGLVFGTPQQDDATNLELARELDIVVFSASYRLAPKHPAPAALDDLVAGLRDVLARAEEFGIDPHRIAIGGASAGGGLAAGLAQRLLDEGGPQPVFQLLVYPMLDDRTNLRDDIDTRHLRIWSRSSNIFGWTSYLQMDAASPDVPAEFVPARRDDLTALPPAWIGVGSLDLFHDEDVEYARRLEEAGVPCTLTVIPGAFHGFDATFSKAAVSKSFHAEWARVLEVALADPPSDS